MGKRRNGNQEDSSERVNSHIDGDPVWSDLANKIWEAPHHGVEHKILRSNNDARGDCPDDIGHCLTYVSAPEASWKLSSSPKNHVTFENKVVDNAQCRYEQKNNPDHGLV